MTGWLGKVKLGNWAATLASVPSPSSLNDGGYFGFQFRPDTKSMLRGAKHKVNSNTNTPAPERGGLAVCCVVNSQGDIPMSRTQFVVYARRYGVRSAAWLACQLGVSLTLVQLWLRQL